MFSASDSSKESRSFAIGPLKVQILTYSAASGDTSGTITADRLSSAIHVFVDGGLKYTAAPTFSANVVTLTFADPLVNIFGSVIVIGR